MTDEAADIVYAEIQKTDILTGAKTMPFAEGLEKGIIEYVGDDCINALYEAIEARSIRPGICKTAGLKLVYSPLNGSGLVPVTHVCMTSALPISYRCAGTGKAGRNFPHLDPVPQPVISRLCALAWNSDRKSGTDLMLATRPRSLDRRWLFGPLSDEGWQAKSCRFRTTSRSFCCVITSVYRRDRLVEDRTG